MKARYRGSCSACGDYHIQPGDDILEHRGGWAKCSCIDDQRRWRQFEKKVEKEMLEEHSTAMFDFGLPKGTAIMFTRGSFWGRARDLDVITEDEYKDAYRRMATIWLRDLSD